jgi:glucokinase
VIGASVPAVLNPATKRIEKAYTLADLQEIDLHWLLSTQLHLPVVLEESANAAAYGEFVCGAAQGLQNVLFVELGSDIRAALILRGSLYRGLLGYAGGFGHITVNPDGLECDCGNIGCLETIASGTNLVRRTKERLFHDRSSSLSSLALPQKGELTAGRIAQEAVDGDDFALMMLDRTGKWVGLALANIINLLNLDMVVLAGEVVAAGDLFLRSVTNEIRQRALETPRAHCRLVVSALGQESGLIGAAMLARDTLSG